MYLSVHAGHVVNAPDALPTLSDGSAGPFEVDSITFGICNELIDRFILIDEADIEKAIRYLYKTHQMIVEGSAGVAMASAMQDSKRKQGAHAVVVLCGGNIDPKIHSQICDA
jgi:threonine dehydratase